MDVYVDGGLHCNYPIYAFDGKWGLTSKNAAVDSWFDLGKVEKKIVDVYLVLFIQSFDPFVSRLWYFY